MSKQEKIEFKVAGSTKVKQLSTSLAIVFREGKGSQIMLSCIGPGSQIMLSCIGPAAIGQAIKSIAIARGIIAASSSTNLAVVPCFSDTMIDGKEVTTIQLHCIEV